MSKQITQTQLKRETRETFKRINLNLKYLNILHELSLLKKDVERAVFEKKIKAHIGESNLCYIEHLKHEKN